MDEMMKLSDEDLEEYREMFQDVLALRGDLRDTFGYPQKPDICLVETSDSYKLMWYNKRNKWWYDCDTNEPYADNTRNFKWVYLDDILENIE